MTQIKFGTDGWRAIIAKDYTIANLKRVAEATAKWMLKKSMKKAVIGYDTRFGGKMFAEEVAKMFCNFDIEVILSTDFVSTPMVSLAVVKTESDMGIVITASHNPPGYNGYKLKSAYGGPTIPAHISEIESIIPEDCIQHLTGVDELLKNGKLKMLNLEDIYIDHIQQNFDLDLIQTSGITLAYDAMYGAGQNVIKRLFPKAICLHCEQNPSFDGQAPEPIARNLNELSNVIKNDPSINLGLANDGDADRIGLFDSNGHFVDSHHILLLLLTYLYEYKKMTGKVIITFSVTDKMKKLAAIYGLDYEVTKIGFKYIAEIMTNEDVIVGGEESGGLAVKGHIPERDGIWNGLVIMEFMAKTGKSLEKLIQDVYNKIGPFAFDRDDLHLTNDEKQDVIAKCKEGKITQIGERKIVRTENIDGFKFYLSEEEWVMIRPSGTEPVLRVYSQAPSIDQVKNILADTHKELKV